MPVEITKEHIRIRVKDPRLFVPESFRTVELSKEKGISAVMRKLKSNPNGPMVVQVYLFDVKKWTLDKARLWIDEHKAAPCRFDCPQVCQAATSPIGRAIGLAVKSDDNGVLMPVSAVIVPGTGQIIITGQLQEVMEESAKVAISLLRAKANEDLSHYDFHIHIPPGGLRKDGPSAGLAMFLALWSAKNQRPLPQNLAITGEIDLNGNIRRVGGIKEKSEAAYMAGMGGMVLPKDNILDAPLNDVPIPFHFAETVDEALKIMESSHCVAGKEKKEEDETMDRLAVIKAAGLEETASDETLLAGIAAMRQSLEEKEKLLASAPKKDDQEKLQARVAVLEKQLAAYGEVAKINEKEKEKERVETFLARGMKEGKIPPAAEVEWRTLAEKDYGMAEKLLAASPQVVPSDRIGAAPKGKAQGIDAAQKAINRLLGLSKETFLKYSAKAQEEN